MIRILADGPPVREQDLLARTRAHAEPQTPVDVLTGADQDKVVRTLDGLVRYA